MKFPLKILKFYRRKNFRGILSIFLLLFQFLWAVAFY